MDKVFEFGGIEFQWDVEKYETNLRKHKVSFEEAVEVFFDDFCCFGDASVEGEQREYVIGFSFQFNLLFTVFIERSERIRIISARPATFGEEKLYAKTK